MTVAVCIPKPAVLYLAVLTEVTVVQEVPSYCSAAPLAVPKGNIDPVAAIPAVNVPVEAILFLPVFIPI